MSERGSFVSEYLYCKECFEALGKVLSAEFGDDMAVLGARIFAGFVGGLWSGQEAHDFDIDLRDKIEPVICHPVQIAVMSEAQNRRTIMTFMPGRYNEDPEQRGHEDAAFLSYAHSLLSLRSREERVALIEKMGNGFCSHCGDEEKERRCQCWNDE